jgi:DNA adenine methylase
MNYMGGKFKLSKYIIPIMLSERKADQYWVEPFVGGGNIIDKVEGNRIGADIDVNTIHALISIRDNLSELPKNNKEFTEKEYKELKQESTYKHKEYAGFAFSYGGKWLGGWAKNSTGRDYVAEAYRAAVRQSQLLQGVVLVNTSFLDLLIPLNSLIYCDPPYENTTKYKNGINYSVFWEWCRNMSNEGHNVFVSGYDAPTDFECIWEMEVLTPLSSINTKKATEKLFKYKKRG